MLSGREAGQHSVAEPDATPATPRCHICAGTRLQQLFAKDGYAVARCADCTLQFLDPQPDDATLAKIYDAGYFLGKPGADAEDRVQRMKRATAALYVERLVLGLGKAQGRILEIGCGRGEFLLEARSRGFEVSGIEFSKDAAAIANRRLGTETVQAGTIEDARHSASTFDAVVFADVLEHVRDPLDFLKRVYALLKDGALVLLATPALDSFSARLLGRHWMEYKVEHLYYFNRRSIRLALGKAGFREVSIGNNRKVLSLDYVCHHFQRFPVPLFTPLLKAARKMAPSGLAYRHWQVSASGLLVTARR